MGTCGWQLQVCCSGWVGMSALHGALLLMCRHCIRDQAAAVCELFHIGFQSAWFRLACLQDSRVSIGDGAACMWGPALLLLQWVRPTSCRHGPTCCSV